MEILEAAEEQTFTAATGAAMFWIRGDLGGEMFEALLDLRLHHAGTEPREAACCIPRRQAMRALRINLCYKSERRSEYIHVPQSSKHEHNP
jgi:hypothetical protein